MNLRRRSFLKLSAGSAATGAALFSGINVFASSTKKNLSLDRLQKMTDDVV
ncbi:MAG: twin-arginine translocation signal domain-containing protein, partial [Bacteroidetes bacterium]|nr:twin-arginine translocation signal domain-containing protein [Bacteroidota bacterium]